VACCWASVLGAYLSRTKCRERVWLPEAAPGAGWCDLWWLATSVGLVLMCEPISWPKCSRGSPACNTVSVLIGGCCGLLPPLDVLPEDLVPPGRCRFSREVGKVSRISCRWSSVCLGGLTARPSRL
jgi:hypothetical protein